MKPDATSASDPVRSLWKMALSSLKEAAAACENFCSTQHDIFDRHRIAPATSAEKAIAAGSSRRAVQGFKKQLLASVQCRRFGPYESGLAVHRERRSADVAKLGIAVENDVGIGKIR